MFSTRSVGLNLARRFNAWRAGAIFPRRVATIEFTFVSGVATRRKTLPDLFPALKSRSKFRRRYASKTLDQRFLWFVSGENPKSPNTTTN